MSRRRAIGPHRPPDGDLALAPGLRLTEVAVGEHRITLRLTGDVSIELEGDLTVAGRRMKLREAAYSVLETLGRTLTHATIARGDLRLTFEKTHIVVAHADPKHESFVVTAPNDQRIVG